MAQILKATERQRFPAGAHAIPVHEHWGTRGHQAHLDVRDHLRNPHVHVAVAFDVSTDGGQTWSYGGGFTYQPARDDDGQVIPLDKNGDPWRYIVAVFGHEHPHPDPALDRGPAARRLIKGTMTVTGGEVTTRLHLAGTKGVHIDKSLIPQD